MLCKEKKFFLFSSFFFPSCLDKNLAISVIHGYIYGNDVVDIDLFFLVSCLFPFTFDWSGRNKLEKKKNKLIKWKFTFYREIFLFFRCSLMNSNSFFFFFYIPYVAHRESRYRIRKHKKIFVKSPTHRFPFINYFLSSGRV